MKLYLVQHGEAAAKEIDPARPLTERGRREVETVTAFLVNSGSRIGKVVHSGKLRAEQTAHIFAAALSVKEAVAAIGGINPNDSVAAFSEVLSIWTTDTVVVGHLPFMEKLVTYLTTGQSDNDVVLYQPGTIVCLERDNENSWNIIWMIRPELL